MLNFFCLQCHHFNISCWEFCKFDYISHQKEHLLRIYEIIASIPWYVMISLCDCKSFFCKNKIGPKSPAKMTKIKLVLKFVFMLLKVMLIQWVMCKCCGLNTKKCLRSVCISRPSRSFRSFWFFSTVSSNLVGTYICRWRGGGLLVRGNSDRPF